MFLDFEKNVKERKIRTYIQRC